MWAIIRRAVVPAVLLVGGLASLIYGAIFHAVPVVEDHESETTIEVPAEFSPQPPMGKTLARRRPLRRAATDGEEESHTGGNGRGPGIGTGRHARRQRRRNRTPRIRRIEAALVSNEGPALCPS